jgi:hypothetical protein
MLLRIYKAAREFMNFVLRFHGSEVIMWYYRQA